MLRLTTTFEGDPSNESVKVGFGGYNYTLYVMSSPYYISQMVREVDLVCSSAERKKTSLLR